MKLTIELATEEDGRAIAEVMELPGVMCYGTNEADAIRNVQILALRVLAENLEYGELPDDPGLMLSFHVVAHTTA